MTRPKCCRKISGKPRCGLFMPVGAPAIPEEIVLSIDEFEAIRLADLEGLYQEKAAEQMNVSRQTFGRIIESARKKMARALVGGFALRIEKEEGAFERRSFVCRRCAREWVASRETESPSQCPACGGPGMNCPGHPDVRE
ncbi:MAG: DUF134 domain-containing protein [Syntrophobacteraceae bacterium]